MCEVSMVGSRGLRKGGGNEDLEGKQGLPDTTSPFVLWPFPILLGFSGSWKYVVDPSLLHLLPTIQGSSLELCLLPFVPSCLYQGLSAGEWCLHCQEEDQSGPQVTGPTV